MEKENELTQYTQKLVSKLMPGKSVSVAVSRLNLWKMWTVVVNWKNNSKEHGFVERILDQEVSGNNIRQVIQKKLQVLSQRA